MKLNKEKYLIYEFGLTGLFFVDYLFLTFRSINSNNSLFSIYFAIVVFYTIAIVLMTLFLLYITKAKDLENDERDRAIELKGYRNAYISIVGIINILIVLCLLLDVLFQPFIIFNILFSSLFISHIVNDITQLYYYRRGI